MVSQFLAYCMSFLWRGKIFLGSEWESWVRLGRSEGCINQDRSGYAEFINIPKSQWLTTIISTKGFFLANIICPCGLAVPLLCIFNPEFSLTDQSLFRTLSVLWQERRQGTILWLRKSSSEVKHTTCSCISLTEASHTTTPVFNRVGRKLDCLASSDIISQR